MYELILVVLSDLKLILCGTQRSKNLSKCFSTALVSHEAALLDGLSITATIVTSLAE